MPSGKPLPGPRLVPLVFLDRGMIVFPEEDEARPEPLRDPAGNPVDVFDAVDVLFARYQRLYVVDLEGLRFRRPQFEFLQEIGRGQDMWVDAGPRNADEVMDVLVAGASRAVLSTSTLAGAREIARSLKLTTELALEIVWEEGGVVAHDESLASAPVATLAQEARERGIAELVLSPRAPTVDWSVVAAVARAGPTYVRRPTFPVGMDELTASGAQGGIFYAKEVLEAWTTSGS
jgi:hypothetical protein